MDKQPAEVLRGIVTTAERHFELGSRFGLDIALGSLVRDEVACADAADAQRFVGFGEIAVRGIKIVVGLDAALALDRAQRAESFLQRGKIDTAKFLLDFHHYFFALTNLSGDGPSNGSPGPGRQSTVSSILRASAKSLSVMPPCEWVLSLTHNLA